MQLTRWLLIGAMTKRPHFMRPCKSSSLDYRSLFDTSCLVKNKNGFCGPILIGPQNLVPNKHSRSEHIGPIIAYSYRFDVVESFIAFIRYCFWRKKLLKKLNIIWSFSTFDERNILKNNRKVFANEWRRKIFIFTISRGE